MSRCSRKVRQLEFDLSALPAMQCLRGLESVAVALAETMAECGHYNIDSNHGPRHVSAAGGKEGLITGRVRTERAR